MTESGDLHVLDVTPADGLSRFRCRALHHLTGKSQVSVSPARIIVTGTPTFLSVVKLNPLSY